MTKRAKRCGSDALAAVHETASDLHEAGLLDKRTMRTFDDLCLTLIEEFTPQQIVELRLREHASQAVFARYPNVTPSTVSQWERGEKRPRGPSLKLLTLVAKGGGGRSLEGASRQWLTCATIALRQLESVVRDTRQALVEVAKDDEGPSNRA